MHPCPSTSCHLSRKQTLSFDRQRNRKRGNPMLSHRNRIPSYADGEAWPLNFLRKIIGCFGMRSVVYAVERGVTGDLSGDLYQVLSQRGNRNNAIDTIRMVLYKSIGIEFSQPTRLRVFIFASPLAITREYLWLKHCHWISDWFPRRLCPYYDDAQSPPRRWVTNGEALPLNFLRKLHERNHYRINVDDVLKATPMRQCRPIASLDENELRASKRRRKGLEKLKMIAEWIG